MNEHTQTLIEREQIQGTPFTLINHEEKYFIVMGDHRLTEPTKHKNEQYLKLESEKWNILTNIIIIIIDRMNQQAQILADQEEENFREYMKTEGTELYNKNQNYK